MNADINKKQMKSTNYSLGYMKSIPTL